VLRPTSNYIAPKIVATPISVVWLRAWMGLHKLIIQFRAGFLSLSVKGYYATGTNRSIVQKIQNITTFEKAGALI